MPLLFWQRNDQCGQAYRESIQPFRVFPSSVPRLLLSSLRFSVSSRFPPQILLTFYPTYTRAHTYTSARLVSPTLPPSSLTYFFLAFFYFRSGQPHSQRIPSSPPSSPRVAYIPISISIIAEELPASLGASQGCGLQMVFRRYFRFPLLPVRNAYLDVSPSRKISRYLSIDVSLLLSFSLSLSLSSILVAAVILFPSSRFVLFR